MTKEVIVATGNRSGVVEPKMDGNALFELVDWYSLSTVLQKLPQGTPLKLVACVEPKVISPEGAEWIRSLKSKPAYHELYVPGVGIVAHILFNSHWTIYRPHADDIHSSMDVNTHSCELCLAEKKLYGFRLGGE